jgi:hypothetical protein
VFAALLGVLQAAQVCHWGALKQVGVWQWVWVWYGLHVVLLLVLACQWVLHVLGTGEFLIL